MSNRKKVRKKYNFRDKANNMIVGLILEWSDKSPLVDDEGKTTMRVSHKNPTRRTYVKEMAKTSFDYIKNQRAFMWLVDMNTIFNLENGKPFVVETQLEVYATIDEFNQCMIECLEEDRRKGPEDGYSHVEFRLECIGKNPPPPIEHQIKKQLKGE